MVKKNIVFGRFSFLRWKIRRSYYYCWKSFLESVSLFIGRIIDLRVVKNLELSGRKLLVDLRIFVWRRMVLSFNRSFLFIISVKCLLGNKKILEIN